MPDERYVIDVLVFINVLIINFFSNNTVSMFETFMEISTMNTKSGTNRILPHRTKRAMTLNLQKQIIWFKKQQKEQLFSFDMIPNTHTFWTNFIFNKIFSACTICLYRLYIIIIIISDLAFSWSARVAKS